MSAAPHRISRTALFVLPTFLLKIVANLVIHSLKKIIASNVQTITTIGANARSAKTPQPLKSVGCAKISPLKMEPVFVVHQ